MAGSTFGTLFTITTWGESHGPALGVVVDGCPAGIPLTVIIYRHSLTAGNPDKANSPQQERNPIA